MKLFKTYLLGFCLLLIRAYALAGEFHFQTPTNSTVGTDPLSICITDFNGDSYPDIASANWNDTQVSILLNKGDGTMGVPINIPIGQAPHSICAANFDGDNLPDLAVNTGAGNIIILQNQGAGSFSVTQSYPEGNSYDIFASDVNGDNYPDLVISNGNIMLGNGNGSFTLGTPFTSQGGYAVHAADFSGDGLPDIAITNESTLRVWINQGNGVFSAEATYSAGSGCWGIASLDVNGDGQLDLATANHWDNSISVFLNQGSGTFDAQVRVVVGMGPERVSAGDFDGDGRVDLAVGDVVNQDFPLLRNIGGTVLFVADTVLTAASNSKCAEVADFDKNGSLDIAGCSYGGATVSVFLNKRSQATDSLIIPSARPCDPDYNMVQPISVKITQPIVGVNIPLKIPSGATIDSITLASAIHTWHDYSVIKSDSGFMQIVAAAGTAAPLPIGTSNVFNVHFKAARQCNTNWYIHWDTTLSGFPARKLAFSDTANITFYPDFDRLRDSTTISSYTPGNVNGTGIVDISDLSCLISYLTGGGSSCICIMAAANLNGSGIVDLGDLTALVNYVTGGGYVPKCAPAMVGSEFAKVSSNASLETDFANGITTLYLTSTFDLSAIHVVVKGGALGAVNTNAGKYDLLHGSADGCTNLILIDLNGKNFIESGKQTLLEIPGQVEIVSATVSDMEFNSWTPVLNGAAKPNDLPTSFALSQNYPNPFNPSTNISFSLPVASNYTLAIFNVNGQMVEEFNGHSEAGTASLVWDGSRVASGVYLYRLTAGEFTQTKKMMLLK